jgi:hypothetical protein
MVYEHGVDLVAWRHVYIVILYTSGLFFIVYTVLYCSDLPDIGVNFFLVTRYSEYISHVCLGNSKYIAIHPLHT